MTRLTVDVKQKDLDEFAQKKIKQLDQKCRRLK